MSKTRACLWLSPADRSALEEWVSGRNTPQKLVWRSRIILLSANRVGVMAITRAVGMSKVTVARWQERYLAKGIAGLQRDASRPGRLKPLSADTIERVVQKTLHEKPPKGRWSIRKMAKASGLSYSSVQRIWKAHELKPHRVKTFKLSQRQAVCRQGAGRCWPLSQSAGQGAGVLSLREDPDPGARSHAARPTAEEGPLRNHDPRLQTAWHHHVVRRARRCHRQG